MELLNQIWTKRHNKVPLEPNFFFKFEATMKPFKETLPQVAAFILQNDFNSARQQTLRHDVHPLVSVKPSTEHKSVYRGIGLKFKSKKAIIGKPYLSKY